MFDLAAVAEHFGSDYVLSALKQCPPDKCKTALEVIDKTNPAYVEGIIGQLMLREHTRSLVAQSRDISRNLIELAITNRSEERRVGKEWVSKCRTRGWPEQ